MMQREEQVGGGGQRPVLNLIAENCHIFFRRRCCSAPLVRKAANALRMAQGLELLVFLAEEEAAEEEEEEEGGRRKEAAAAGGVEWKAVTSSHMESRCAATAAPRCYRFPVHFLWGVVEQPLQALMTTG